VVRPHQRQGDEDKCLAAMMNVKALPFDAKRMIFGALKVLVEA
jgi:hypothetical protein